MHLFTPFCASSSEAPTLARCRRLTEWALSIDMIASHPRLATPLTFGRELSRLGSRARLGFGLKLGISAALIGFVCRHLDVGSVVGRFAGQSAFWLAAAALISLSQILLVALRWEQILKGLGAQVATGTLLTITYISSFFNSWLLGTASGDAVRAMLVPTGSVGRAGIVHSVLFDRLATLAGLGVVIVPLVVLDVGPFARSLPLLASLAVVALPFITMAGIIWIVAPRFAGRTGALFGRLRGLTQDWLKLCRAWPRFGAALTVAALGQLAIAATACCLARAQHLDVSFIDFLMLMPPVTLLVALPISAGGWGLRESAMVVALAPVGVTAGSALLLSVEMGALAALLSLPGGVIWLCRYLSRPLPLALAPR